MALTDPEWETVKQIFDQQTTWLLIPGRADAFVPMFQGTLNEAIAEALRHATFWETSTTVYHAPEGRYHGKKTPVARVGTVPDSPLRRM